MKNKSCPISCRLTDGTIARIGAYFFILFIIAYLYTIQIVFLYILAIDFFIRIYLKKSYSTVFQLSRLVKKILKLKTKMTAGAAKRLAAQFGLIFSIMLAFEVLLDFKLAFYITVSILFFVLCWRRYLIIVSVVKSSIS